MNRSPSLKLRIMSFLIVAQVAAFSIGWGAGTLLNLFGSGDFSTTINDLAYYRTLDLVVGSIVCDDKGCPRIEPKSDLLAEVAENRKLKYAIFDPTSGKLLPGSEPRLLQTFFERTNIQALRVEFKILNEDGVGLLKYVDTPAGRFRIAVFGYKFRSRDVLHAFMAESSDHINYLLPPLLLSIGVTWFAVRQGLGPLRAAIDGVERVNMDSLTQDISADNIPVEVLPFVQAVNRALRRLDAGALRMRRYIANAAHELRTPLAIMRARLEDVEEPSFKSDLRSDVSQLQALVEQMLVTARIAEDQAAIDEEIELVSTIREIVLDYFPLVVACGRKLEFEAEATSVVTIGNRRAIECVTANLIDNALRAEPIGGTVLVKIHSDATIAVIDHGDGIDASDRERVFEPFWRKEQISQGTGLGLAIARELIEKLRGRIWAEDTPGGGATLKVALTPQATEAG